MNKVVELFDNLDNMKKWMEGLQSFETMNGIPGQEGAKSKLHFKMGKRKIEMLETITKRNLPEEFTGTYETKGVFNIAKNSFIPIDESRTKYVTEQEFQFKGFMKLIGAVIPCTFKKQTLKYMNAFKEFAENQN